MEIIDWDQRALNAAERDLAGIVHAITARYMQQRPGAAQAALSFAGAETDGLGRSNPSSEAISALTLNWRTLVAIADEAEADIGLQARHEPWVLARLLRLPGDEALRRDGELPPLDALVDLDWPDAPAPAAFRAIVAAFAGDDLQADDAGPFAVGPSVFCIASRAKSSACPA